MENIITRSKPKSPFSDLKSSTIQKNGNGSARKIEELEHINYWNLMRFMFRRHWLLVIAFGVVSSTGLLYYFLSTITYESSATFVVSNWQQKLSGGSDAENSQPSYGLVMQLYSDVAIQDLINKFDLDAGFKTPRDSFAEMQLMRNISSSISITESQFGSFVLKVSWSDPVLAADMANELINKVEEMNRVKQQKILESKVSFMQELVKSQIDTIKFPTNSFEEHLEQISNLQKQLTKTEFDNPMLKQIVSELISLRDELKSNSLKESADIRMNQLLVEVLASPDMKSIEVIQKAIPQKNLAMLTSVEKSGGITILLLLILPLVIFLMRYYIPLSSNQQRDDGDEQIT